MLSFFYADDNLITSICPEYLQGDFSVLKGVVQPGGTAEQLVEES